MTDKLAITNLFKIFGPAPNKALDLAKAGESKDEIYRRTGSVMAVNDISFLVAEGQIFVVMGLSGSGKSTLIRCINRLLEPTGGTVLLDAIDLTRASREELRQVRLYRMSMVFQHFALLPHKTVAENAEYGLKARGMARAERRARAVEALELVGLAAWADAYPANCSGGMQQRVGLARALAVGPEVLLMDEPFSALDPLIRRDMQDELLSIQDRLKTTILFITHDLQEALKLGGRIAIMKDGRFVQIGTPEEIVTAPADGYVAEFTRDVDRSRVLTFRSIMDEAGSAAADTPISELRRRFEADRSSALFVTDASGAPVGLVERARLDGREATAVARQVMDREFTTVRSSQHFFEAFDRIESRRPIAVVNGDGRLVGAVDPLDVFAHLGARPGGNGAAAPDGPPRTAPEAAP